jgi:hypothetical protein
MLHRLSIVSVDNPAFLLGLVCDGSAVESN